MTEVKEDLVLWVLRGLGPGKQGRKYGRTSPPFSYAWACSLRGVRDRILHGPCQKVGKVLPSHGMPALLPHCLWVFLTGGLSVPGCCGGVSGLIGTFFVASIQGGHPVSLVTREMSRICVFTAPRLKMTVWTNADYVPLGAVGMGETIEHLTIPVNNHSNESCFFFFSLSLVWIHSRTTDGQPGSHLLFWLPLLFLKGRSKAFRLRDYLIQGYVIPSQIERRLKSWSRAEKLSDTFETWSWMWSVKGRVSFPGWCNAGCLT